jgi:hypothetical protein
MVYVSVPGISANAKPFLSRSQAAKIGFIEPKLSTFAKILSL